jgi:hypothetical protein
VEWDDEERAWMLALASLDAGRCPGGCGGQLHETTDPDVDWEGVPPTECFKCKAIAAKQAEVLQPDKDTGRPRIKYSHLLWGAKRI